MDGFCNAIITLMSPGIPIDKILPAIFINKHLFLHLKDLIHPSKADVCCYFIALVAEEQPIITRPLARLTFFFLRKTTSILSPLTFRLFVEEYGDWFFLLELSFAGGGVRDSERDLSFDASML